MPGDASTMSDRILVEAVLAGDMSAFATLYRAHVRAVTAAVGDNVHDPESIADVIQEVFLRALERLGTLRDLDRFGPWLLSIARHAAVDHRRSLGRSPILDDFAVEPAATTSGPDTVAELNELAGLIRTCVGQLSTRDATALTLVTQLGLGPGDIANALDVSPGAAKVILHRARRRLRDTLALELLVRRRGGGCAEFDALFVAGDFVGAGHHVRSCLSCRALADSEVSLYGRGVSALA